jgi:hypothetical protein
MEFIPMRSLIGVFALITCLCVATVSEASILGGSILVKSPTGVLNTLDDRDAEYIEKGAGNVADEFEIGDMVHIYMEFQNISSSDGPPPTYFGTPLDDPSAGGPGYVLLGRGTVTIDDIGDFDGDGDEDDISWTGSFDLYENTVGLTFDFTDGIAAADAVIADTDNTLIATIGTDPSSDDFIVSEDAPLDFASVLGAETIDTFFGLSLLAGGTDFGVVPEALNNPDFPNGGSLHDFTGDTQAERFGPAPVIGDDQFDLDTDLEVDLVAADAGIIPEPSALMVWGGLVALVGSLIGQRRRFHQL